MKITIEGIKVDVFKLKISLIAENIDELYTQAENLYNAIKTENAYARYITQTPVEMLEDKRMSCTLCIVDARYPRL